MMMKILLEIKKKMFEWCMHYKVVNPYGDQFKIVYKKYLIVNIKSTGGETVISPEFS